MVRQTERKGVKRVATLLTASDCAVSPRNGVGQLKSSFECDRTSSRQNIGDDARDGLLLLYDSLGNIRRSCSCAIEVSRQRRCE